MSIPISYSEKLGYHAQFHIFNYAYKITKYTQWLLFPALISLGAYGLTCFSSRSASVAELTLRGLGLVLSSTPPSEENTRGWQMLRRVPKQGMNTVAVILFVFTDAVIVSQDPKFYILSNFVRARVNLDHLQAGTIDSEDHNIDLQEATGKVKSGEFHFKECI